MQNIKFASLLKYFSYFHEMATTFETTQRSNLSGLYSWISVWLIENLTFIIYELCKLDFFFYECGLPS